MLNRIQGWILPYRTQLALALRISIAAVLTELIGKFFALPMTLWAVLTSVLLTQISVGRSVRASLDYSLGTLGGALYAGSISSLAPQNGTASLVLTLAAALTPPAFVASLYPRFAVAPTTAAIIVLAPTLTHATPAASAADRVIEVAVGICVALVVSIVVFPARASVLLRSVAADTLTQMAAIAPQLLAGFIRPVDAGAILTMQRRVADAFDRSEPLAADARHERSGFLASDHDVEAMLYDLRRLRHDLILIGRAARAPLPSPLREKLRPALDTLGEVAADHLLALALCFQQGGAPPRTEAIRNAFAACFNEISALRREGGLRVLSDAEVEAVFAMQFALAQWRGDLQRIGAGLAAPVKGA